MVLCIAVKLPAVTLHCTNTYVLVFQRLVSHHGFQRLDVQPMESKAGVEQGPFDKHGPQQLILQDSIHRVKSVLEGSLALQTCCKPTSGD